MARREYRALQQRALAPRTIKATVADLARMTGRATETLVLAKGVRIRFEELAITSRVVDLLLNHSDLAQSTLTLDTSPRACRPWSDPCLRCLSTGPISRTSGSC
ncbi:hypothetical protein MASR1M101_42240 [Gemmatimonas sp.]